MRIAVLILGVSLATWGCENSSQQKAAADPPASATSSAQAKETASTAQSAVAVQPAGAVKPDATVSPRSRGPQHFGSKFSLAKGEPLKAAIARLDGASDAASGSAGAPKEPAKAGGVESGQSCGDGEVESCAEINAEEEGDLVRVTGKVHSICKKAGCWMVLQDGDQKVRIFTKEHGFFLPKDTAAGRSAEVEGTLRAKTLSKKFAQHLAEDSGDDAATVTGPKREYLMTASGVELL